MFDYGIINDRSPHIVADLCEIICYFENAPVSRSDIEGFISSKGGEGLLRDFKSEDGAETNDRIQKFTEDAFRHLSYRQASFGQWYPFTVEGDVLELTEQQTVRHKLYASLLADSRLKMFGRDVREKLSSEFEAICREALHGLFPTWRIYHFGKNGGDRAFFGTKLKEALIKLAEIIRDQVTQHVNNIEENNFGDGGIDLIATAEWADSAESLPVYFCQCAAQQENWPLKRFEAHPVAQERYFSFFHKPGSILFIPLCYREPNGEWIDAAGHQTILVDRLRITELLERQVSNGSKTLDQILGVIASPFEVGSISMHGNA